MRCEVPVTAQEGGSIMFAKRFAPGSVVATPGALESLRASGDDPLVLLERHLSGDWGDADEHDRRENELSVERGWRILPATV